MIPVVGINSSSAPFMRDIGLLLKRLETRNKDMLGSLVGQRVILAETKQGGYIAMYTAVIRSGREIRSSEEWDSLRTLHCVPSGNKYDWQPGTRVKWVYEITDLRRLRPFRVPDGVRHGRVWMEYNPPRTSKKTKGGCLK